MQKAATDKDFWTSVWIKLRLISGYRKNRSKALFLLHFSGQREKHQTALTPNCVAEVVTFEKEQKIIIISNRKVEKGEELTYDYKFDFEDEENKIPCLCGAPNCRKWMN